MPFPLTSPIRFSSSLRKPGLESRLLYTGHRVIGKQVSSTLIPELKDNPGFDAVHGVSMRHQRFICIRLSNPHMTRFTSRLLIGTFTTAAFVRSSFRQFGAFPYRAAPKSPPSSFVQQNAFAFSSHNPSFQRVFLHAFTGSMNPSDSLPAPCDFSLPALYARSLPDVDTAWATS